MKVLSPELDQVNDLLDQSANPMDLANIVAALVSERNELRNDVDRLNAENSALRRHIRFLNRAVAA